MNRISVRSIHFLSSIIILSLTLSICNGPTPTPLVMEEVSDIQVEKAEAEKAIVGTEEIPLPNCGGDSDLKVSFASETKVTNVVAVGTKATTSMGGEVEIPEVVKVKLKAQVEVAYQQTYETERFQLTKIDMAAKAGAHVVYVIQWEEQTFASTVSYAMGGEAYKVPYRYVLRVPKLHASFRTTCPTSISKTAPSPMPPATQTAEAEKTMHAATQTAQAGKTMHAATQTAEAGRTMHAATQTAEAEKTREPSIRLWVDRKELSLGECTYVHWEVDHATAVYFESEPVAGHQTCQVCPERSTKYWLRVEWNGDTIEPNVVVVVHRPTGPKSPLVLDDFENYSSDELLRAAYSINTAGGKNVGSLSLASSPNVGGGTGSAGFQYEIKNAWPDDYAGFDRQMSPQDWRPYNALSVWVKSDRSNMDLVIQFGETDGEVWLYRAKLSTFGTVNLQPPLDESAFELADWKGKQNGHIDLHSVSYYGLFVGAGGLGSGTIFIDDIRVTP
jgi:hypothetical protein